MDKIKIYNPFNAVVYHEEAVSSTMDVSRQLEKNGEPHGTVVAADFQTAGRGRAFGRTWEMDREENLPFTILLKYPSITEIPAALTLRAGLAVSLAIEDFAPCLKDLVFVKWPNDIMINNKKAVGILCEADGGNVHLGIGINVGQREFPEHLRGRATSIFNEQLTINNEQSKNTNFTEKRFALLEKIIARLYGELQTPAGKNWKYCLEQKLYKNGEEIVFVNGAVDSGKEIKGRIAGIGENGELLILPDGEKNVSSFVTGEMK